MTKAIPATSLVSLATRCGLRAACAAGRIRLSGAAPAEPFRIVMRGSPYKPRLPRDRKLWPVVFPLPSPLPPSAVLSGVLLLSARLLSPLASSSWPMRERKTDVARVPAHGFSLLPGVGRGGVGATLFPSPLAVCMAYAGDRSGKTNSIFFGKKSARARQLVGLHVSRPFAGPRAGSRDVGIIHVSRCRTRLPGYSPKFHFRYAESPSVILACINAVNWTCFH